MTPAFFPAEPAPWRPVWVIERADGFEFPGGEREARRRLRALARRGEAARLTRVVGSGVEEVRDDAG